MRIVVAIGLLGILCVAPGICMISLSEADQIDSERTVLVNIGINYGSGPVEWHNDTAVAHGEDLLNATMRLATVDHESFAGLGAFVTGINDVRQDPAANLYWIYWVYDVETQQYQMPPVGASAYMLTFDQTVQWYYENGGSLTSPALRPYTTLSINVRLDSSNPNLAIISGSIYPNPSGPVNVTLEYSSDQGASYQQISRITSASEGSFAYSWQLPTAGTYLIRAEAQGMWSNTVSVGTSGGGIPGFPLESLMIGGLLGTLLLILRCSTRSRRQGNHTWDIDH